MHENSPRHAQFRQSAELLLVNMLSYFQSGRTYYIACFLLSGFCLKFVSTQCPIEHICGDNDVVLDASYLDATGSNTSRCVAEVFDPSIPLNLTTCGLSTYRNVAYDNIKLATCSSDCINESAVVQGLAGVFWNASAFGPCSASCDGGIQTRRVVCLRASDGATVDNNFCVPRPRPLQNRQCNSVPCAAIPNGTTLELTPLGSCNGCVQQRSAQCAAKQSGLLLDDDQCLDYSTGQLFTTCGQNTSTCQPIRSNVGSCIANCSRPLAYRWSVGAFGLCSAPCGGGNQTRTVTCLDQENRKALDTECTGDKPPFLQPCNLQSCDVCSGGCSGEGTCRDGTCVCTATPQGIARGESCEIPATCPGILDSNGNCCLNGRVDLAGNCCGDSSVLDSRGRCCDLGLDACGICAGNGRYLSVDNTCCNVTLGADGYCCRGVVDSCGVCGGDGTSCVSRVPLNFQLQTSDLLDVLAQSSVDFLSTLNLTSSSQDVPVPLTFSPGSTLTARATLDIDPSPGASAVAATLTAAVGATIPKQASILLSAIGLVENVATCGNGVCELAERFSCPQDCPYAFSSCPQDCNEHGRCLNADGKCVCYIGYDGDACEVCAPGFIRVANICSRYVRDALPPPTPGSTLSAGTLSVIAVAVALSVIGLAFFLIGGCLLYRWRKNKKKHQKQLRRSYMRGASQRHSQRSDQAVTRSSSRRSSSGSVYQMAKANKKRSMV